MVWLADEVCGKDGWQLTYVVEHAINWRHQEAHAEYVQTVWCVSKRFPFYEWARLPWWEARLHQCQHDEKSCDIDKSEYSHSPSKADFAQELSYNDGVDNATSCVARSYDAEGYATMFGKVCGASGVRY